MVANPPANRRQDQVPETNPMRATRATFQASFGRSARGHDLSKHAWALGEFKPDRYGPNMLGFEWSLLADDATLVPSRTQGTNGR